MVDSALETMKANLPEKTGKSLEDWLLVLGPLGFEKHGEIMKYLKGEQSVSHGYANFIALQFLETKTGKLDDSGLVDAQYSGAKAELRPIYEAILAIVQQFGGGVDISPKKSSVSLRRSKQFALVTPATKTRIDLGLNMKGEPTTDRLVADKGMCTHKIAITSVDEVDGEVSDYLRKAYDLA